YTVQNLARLGLSVAVYSALPDDALGMFVETTLNRGGVDTSLVQTFPDTLGGIGVYMLLFGSRKRPLAYRMPTHPLWPLEYSAAQIETLLDARVLHNGGYLHHQEAWHGQLRDLYRHAHERGLITTIDPQFPLFVMSPPWLEALADVLPFIDVLFCDEHEARNMTAASNLADAARRLLDAGAETVVVKQGAEGSTTFSRETTQHQDAVIISEVVDTIGAGDTYDAAFIYGLLQGWPLEKQMRFASLAAGFSVTGVGGSQSMPDLQTLLNRM
ncbi:MAG: hypothetical protein H7175_17905, partial [Burkholderiales bacterium]|nr:hypothetical protein [Anaerolineae bacterium]